MSNTKINTTIKYTDFDFEQKIDLCNCGGEKISFIYNGKKLYYQTPFYDDYRTPPQDTTNPFLKNIPPIPPDVANAVLNKIEPLTSILVSGEIIPIPTFPAIGCNTNF